MKNYQAQNLLKEATKLNGLSGFAFAMGISKGKKHLLEEQEVLNDIAKPSDEYNKMIEESREIYKKYSLKNEDGTPKTKKANNQEFFDIDERQREELVKEMAKFEKKHKTLIDEQIAKNEAYNKAMLEDSTFVPYEIAEKQMPKDITVEQMDIALYFFKIKN